MDAIVYIGHGSLIAEGNKQFIKFIEEVKKEMNIPVQETAFLELVSPSIFETMEKVMEAGAKDILVVPVLLFAAAHFKRDIPEELARIKVRFPKVNFYVSEPFDLHPKMVDLVIKRIQEKRVDNEGSILIVGRGSSDQEPILKLMEMSNNIYRRLDVPVYTAFLTAGKPGFVNELEKLQQEYSKIYIVPYLLFTGMLVKRMEKVVRDSRKDIILCNPLQYDSLLKEVLVERMEEQLLAERAN
jgi:sirohydrochlorin ferrochelatase